MLTKPLQIPHTPGVYFFKKGNEALYVGKANNIARRLSSYWRKNGGTKVESLLHEADTVEWRELESEVDALIKEAEYIKNHIPKYNVLLRDDKSYFYVAITREEFPKIFISHNPYNHLPHAARRTLRANYIGPFTSGNSLRIVLRMLRKIFPYCTCLKPHKRPCLNAEIGKCFGYCCRIMIPLTQNTNREEYKKNIQDVVDILSGKKKRLLVKLKREMKQAAREENFEQAARIRSQIEGLENIFLHTPILDGQKILRAKRNWTDIQKIIQSLFITEKKITRVEGYDISHISGTEATGSMAVFINGKTAKSEYRKFRIKSVRGSNDFAMIQEVIRRRLGHHEWQYPDLMLIDGGKPQLHATLEVLRGRKLDTREKKEILIAGLAKREEELYIPGRAKPILLRTLTRDTEFFLEHVRNESHRFAKRYHHKLRQIKYREK